MIMRPPQRDPRVPRLSQLRHSARNRAPIEPSKIPWYLVYNVCRNRMLSTNISFVYPGYKLRVGCFDVSKN